MKQIFIGSNEADQRLDKMLLKYFRFAPKSFVYKMLRKKNITRNGRKCDGSEMLHAGDEIKLFLSDETIDKFTGSMHIVKTVHPRIVYEDSQVLVINKPVGVLSQKAQENDISLVEQIISYLIDTEQLTKAQLRTFRPSVCNRLDRNTTGLVVAGKTLPALQALSKLFHDRGVKKFYRCIVRGRITEPALIKGFLLKDETTNQVTVTEKLPTDNPQSAQPIHTAYKPLATNDELTLLEVELLTGRTHQIRAHLAAIGHPIIGDYKYGDPETNQKYFLAYTLKTQMLHSCRLEFPQLTGTLAEISNQVITAREPRIFKEICEREGLKP